MWKVSHLCDVLVVFLSRSIRQLLDEGFQIESWDLNLVKCRTFEAQEIELYHYISWPQVQEPTPVLIFFFYIRHPVVDLKEIPFEEDLKFASFDVANMYTNIPTNELSIL
jgi:hypothetical protein